MASLTSTSVVVAVVLLMASRLDADIQFPSSQERVFSAPHHQAINPKEEDTHDQIQFRYGNETSGVLDAAVLDAGIEKIGSYPGIADGILRMTLNVDRIISPPGTRLEHDVGNVVYSPLSVAALLALVLLGAGGRTLTEVARVLGVSDAHVPDTFHRTFADLLTQFDVDGVEKTTLTTLATAIFVQSDYAIRASFARSAHDVYKSEIQSVDFARASASARNAINSWVDRKTLGIIKELLQRPPERDTKVILASTLYFNGEWEFPFPSTLTARRRPFYVSGPYQNESDVEVMQVTMMANHGELPYHQDADLGCKIVSLPYKGRHIMMHLILPSASGYDGLHALRDRLTVNTLDTLIANTRPRSTIVSIPRMRLDATINLRSTLETLGLTSLFDPTVSDLSGVAGAERQDAGDGRRRSSNPGLYATEVIHKAVVDVTETGTVAAAATALSVSRSGSQRYFRADRPFLFVIRHEASKLILFWGAVVRPTP